MKRVLIIGGTGYLGSRLFNYLTEEKYFVDTVDLEWFGNVINPRNYKKDFRYITRKFLDKYSYIIHLAGHSTVGQCQLDPSGAFDNNVINFSELLKKIGKQKFIYASSYRVYGHTGKKSVTELEELKFPIMNYDATKTIIDFIALNSGVECYGLRMATVNGYSPNLRINQIINKLFLEGFKKKQITAFNPKSQFSILGIDDFCRAVLAIIEGKGRAGIYNLASFDTSVGSIGKGISKQLSLKKVEFLESDTQGQVCKIDNSKFEKEFNFKFRSTMQIILNELQTNLKSANILHDQKKITYGL